VEAIDLSKFLISTTSAPQPPSEIQLRTYSLALLLIMGEKDC